MSTSMIIRSQLFTTHNPIAQFIMILKYNFIEYPI